MPKRRLPREIAGEENVTSSSSSSLPESSRQPQQPSNRSSSQRRSSNVLLSLSNACNKHATYHQGRRKASGRIDDDEENLPEKCRKDLQDLRKLLPKVEKSFRPPARGERGPKAEDVASLCDFYRSALNGGYCPHAPHLFHWGKVPQNVLVRVHYLFQHLVTRAVATSVKVVPPSKSDETSPQPVLETVSYTIAHLLSFLTDDRLYPSILSDLINILVDCAVVLEGNMLPVQLVVLSETVRNCGLPDEYTLDVQNMDEIWVLQTSTLLIVLEFLQNLKSKRLDPKSETLPESYERNKAILPMGSVDFTFYQDLTNNETLTLLLQSAIRPILLSTKPTNSPNELWIQRKLASLKVLTELCTDWHKCHVEPQALVESAVLIARATKTHLGSKTKDSGECAAALASLLGRFLLEPPNIQHATFPENTQCIVQSPVFPILIDCIALIAARREDRRNILDFMVLRVIHGMLSTRDENEKVRSSLSIATTYFLSHGLFRSLLSLLRDPNFSTLVAGISGMLVGSLDRSHEMEKICQLALEEHAKSDDTNQHSVDKTAQTVNQKLSGSKRKQRSSSPSKNRRAPLQPLEMSISHNKSSRSTGYNENAARSSLSSLWQETVKEFIIDSLKAGKKLAVTFHQRGTDTSDKSNLGGVDDAILVSSGLKVISYIIKRQWNARHSYDATCLIVATTLSTYSKACCDALAPCWKSESSDSDYNIAQTIVSSGLYLHFTMGDIFAKMKSDEFSTVRSTLDSFACLANRVAREKHFRNVPNTFVFEHVTCQCSTLFGLSPCLKIFSRNGEERPRQFWELSSSKVPTVNELHDFSMTLMDSLPLSASSCLLVSLHPLNEDKYSKALVGPRTANYSLDSLCSSFADNSVFSLAETEAGRLPALFGLYFAPLLLSIQKWSHNESKETDSISCTDQHERSEANEGARFFAGMEMFVREILLPVVRKVDPRDHELCRVLLLTVTRLQKFAAESPDSLTVTSYQNATEVLEYTFGGCESMTDDQMLGRNINKCCSDVLVALREAAYFAAERIEQNHLDPFVRRLRWRCISLAIMDSPTPELRQRILTSTSSSDVKPNESETLDRSRFGSLLSWLFVAPLSDSDSVVREELSQGMYRIILAEHYSLLLCLFSSEEDFQCFTAYTRSKGRTNAATQKVYRLLDAADRVVAAFFREVDRLLHDSCGFSESQLSFTMAKSPQGDTSQIDPAIKKDRMHVQRSAVRILSSICVNANIKDPVGKCLFEKAFLRLIRMWAAMPFDRSVDSLFPNLPSTKSNRALAYGEIARLIFLRPKGILVSPHLSEEFIATIFSDLFILSSGRSKEAQYFLLETFIQSFLVESPDFLAKLASKDCKKFLDQQLPALIAQFVVEKDFELLRLTAGFREFVEQRYKDARLKQYGKPYLVGGPNVPLRPSLPAITSSVQDLEKKTRNLCLEPKMTERILPLVFINSDRSGLLFFTKEVLKNLSSLHEIIKGREQLILKNLVWELGRDPQRVGPVVRAIKTAAIARLVEAPGSRKEDEGSGIKDSVKTKDPSAANQWVTSHFMYLLVNAIQYRWKSRTTRVQLHALRCLHMLMDFLLPAEAAQYFPQIMATVNMAIANGDPCNGSKGFEFESFDFDDLRLYAVKSLSRFVERVIEEQIEVIAVNLTTIVVSLIPILEEVNETNTLGTDYGSIQESRQVAVSLLEHLSSGPIGKKLAPYFAEVPFLPSSPALETVHKELRANGVDFDNLLVLSNATQHRRQSLSNDGTLTAGSKTSTASSRNANQIFALRKRLMMICTLFDNESTSVRRVALQHLIDLLRANRDLFHALVDSDESASMKLYLTVVFDVHQTSGPSKSIGSTRRGIVTELMEKLLNRCVHEADGQVRLLLAVCLGEVGAIGEHRLGDLKLGSSMGDASLDSPNSSYRWRLEQPPWQSQAEKYELQLVTQHLAAAIKAAPSSADQHKVAFTIQQLLRLLDNNSATQDVAAGATDANQRGREMSEWLRNKLTDSGVYETIEPFWFSEFSEKTDGFVYKKPPFFEFSPSYYSWIANFCRWMILCANECPLSRWKGFFFACRTAVRTQAGLKVAEFILPLLVLDRICFGTPKDEEVIRREFLKVLSFGSTPTASMEKTEREKAVNAVFNVVDTLSFWAEHETESRQRSSRSLAASSSRGRRKTQNNAHEDSMSITNWPADESIVRIEEVLSTIPLATQADAAASVGMHARAQRLLELEGRKNVVKEVFESSVESNAPITTERRGFLSTGNPKSSSTNLDLMKSVLAKLDDCETMSAVGDSSIFGNHFLQVRDSIQQKEAARDFEGALKDYERALQLTEEENLDSSLVRGTLQCLLELGQFESVLNQVAGFLQRKKRLNRTEKVTITSFAVEAAWRLGRWQMVSDLIDNETEKEAPKLNSPPYDTYRLSTGKAILGIERKENSTVLSAIQSGREALMESLSSVARESYARCYSDIVRLQCLRELENASEILCHENGAGLFTLDEIAHSTTNDGWAWDGRLNLTSSHGASSVISTRVALARIGRDPVLEGTLFLNIGKRSRQSGLHAIAENFFTQAGAAFASIPSNELSKNLNLGIFMDSTKVQIAKLKHQIGESTLALKILGQENVQHTYDLMLREVQDAGGKSRNVRKLAIEFEEERIRQASGVAELGGRASNSNDALVKRFSSRLLRLTQWMVESGLAGGAEIRSRFQIIHELAPSWEKGHFHFGKYVDSVMQSRVTALGSRSFKEKLRGIDEDMIWNNVIFRDRTSQDYILLAMKHYTTGLKIDTKHVYQALPRLLSLWFDFVSIQQGHIRVDDFKDNLKSENLAFLLQNQTSANKTMAINLKLIPPAAFYTAMPQLISRVIHDNSDTSHVVRGILVRVLTKFPQQAMWPLAWLKGSKDNERAKIGEAIFKEAEKNLFKSNKIQAKLLSSAGSLFNYLQQLAKHPSKPPSMSVKPWKAPIEPITLTEFVPPVQAALSISSLSSGQKGAKDFFPRTVPRIRAFSSKVGVMHSKAKPKKLKAFAVPGTYKASKATTEKSQGQSLSKPLLGDIGEIHFLVKQEAKGDLRKDARVQDLNNVINRLMASSSDSGSSSRKRRRLHLRTFAVTCLSEDSGILEWIPDTQALRNLVMKSYNPQASPFCTRRRGQRLADFQNASLRTNYENCQAKYFREGNLSRAAALFGELCLKPYPPVLYWWFVQKFHDPHAWYEARNRFALSTAAWSAVGHVIGLGDRHSENILVDTTNGECVHVDFDCLFDKGLNLPKPEVVPFRLTPNMIDAFGPTGAEGLYASGLQTAMRTLRDNRDTLLSVLEPFLKDPVIDWKRARSQQRAKRAETETAQQLQSSAAKRSIRVIDERLQGIYNLRNPNFRKYRRTDGWSIDQDDEVSRMLPLSVEGQVQKMIAEATSQENLVQLYVGWMPWL